MPHTFTFLIALLLSTVASAQGSFSAPIFLRCEYLDNPLGIDVVRPRLSWVLIASEAELRGQRQAAYQILVASSLERLVRDEGDLWDSGKVQGDPSIPVVYAGQGLESHIRCYWKVRAWDTADRVSPWSGAASWSMGLLQASDWTGQWIAAPLESAKRPGSETAKEGVTTLPLLRKRFHLDQPVRAATLYVSSLGYHRVELNGNKVGDHEFDPVQSDYSRRVYYVTHDVTNGVRQGDNALAVSLGKGWYWPGIRGVTQDRPAVLVELVVSYRDGTQIRVASDGTWQTATSPLRLIGGRRNAGGDFGSEIYDARQEQADWNLASFDDSAWQSADVLQLPPIQRSAQMLAPNRVVARLPAVAVHQTQPSEYLLDFGTNLTGRLRMKLAGLPGDEIGFVYYASHTGDHENLMENFRQSDRYICRGVPGEEFCPQFNWRSFRFVKVIGLSGPPDLSGAVAELIATDLPRTSTFECSDPVLNRLHELVVHTHRCLTLGGIQVDCPHRERLGYGAEGLGSLGQALYNFDAAAFYRKWTRDFQDGQDPQTGMVYYTAPFRINSGGGPAWSGACILFPWHVYLFYGDKRILEEGYPTMRRWLECLESNCQDGLLQPYGLPKMNIWQYLGDWASPRRPDDTLPCSGHWTSEEENQVFNNLHYDLQLTVAARIAGLLGQADDARAYDERARALRQRINAAYFDCESATYTRGEQQQTYLAFPLLLDVVPAEHRTRVWQNLLDDITQRRNGHLDFGVLGGVYTLAALTREGRSDLIYRMAMQRSWPGWGHMIDQGATTLWEHWLPGDSSVHNSFLSIGQWFFSGLAGILPDPDSPGFRRIRLRPQPVPGLEWAKTTFTSPYGLISSGWKIDGQRLVFEFRIPPNTTALVRLPASRIDAIREDGRPIEQAVGVRLVQIEKEAVELEIASGDYQFTLDASP
jgi:alpha-L-rhamnosidase